MRLRYRLAVYAALTLCFAALYAWYDACTEHRIDRGTIFRNWTLRQARHIVDTAKQGDLEIIRDRHLYPIWGGGIFLALTDAGLLRNSRFIAWRGAVVLCLALSVALGASLLRRRFGDRALWFAPLLGLNPVYFQILGGLYDQLLFAALVCLALPMLVKAELSARHRWHWMLAAALLFGLGANLRSDLTYTFPLYLALRVRRADRAHLARLAASAAVFALCLAPWAIAYHSVSGLWSVTGANAGQVVYISLGEGGPGNPWGVAPVDAYDGFEATRRAALVRTSPPSPETISDAWIGKAYLGMFFYKIGKKPAAYVRQVALKLREVLFLSAPRPYTSAAPDAPAPARWLARGAGLAAPVFHLASLWLLVSAGILFCLRGMRYPLFDVGGLFAVATLGLTSLFQYIDRHFFALASCQALALMAASGLLWRAARGRGAQDNDADSSAEAPPKRRLAWALYAVPPAFLLFAAWGIPLLDAWLGGPYRVERVKYWEVSRDLKDNGAAWNLPSCSVMSHEGLWVELPDVSYRKPIEISLHNAYDYVALLYREYPDGRRQPVGSIPIRRKPEMGRGLVNHFLVMPQPARKIGCNLVHIQPVGPPGGRYSMGHFQFRNAPRPQRGVDSP